MAKKAYTRDSLEMALIHHGMDYSPPESPGAGRGKWILRTGIGNIEATEKEVYFYVVGLADHERKTSLTP